MSSSDIQANRIGLWPSHEPRTAVPCTVGIICFFVALLVFLNWLVSEAYQILLVTSLLHFFFS